MRLLCDVACLPYAVAKVFLLGLVFNGNFVCRKYLVFRQGDNEAGILAQARLDHDVRPGVSAASASVRAVALLSTPEVYPRAETGIAGSRSGGSVEARAPH
jgi:hypothetical protein